MTTIAKTIRLSAQLRRVAGAKQVEVAVQPSATVRDLFQAVLRAHHALGDHILEDSGDLKPGIQLLVDGRHIDFLQGMDTPVYAARDLFLIPPIAGG